VTNRPLKRAAARLYYPERGATVRVKILVVDDHPENLLAVEAILERLGQRIFRATSGREALRLCQIHEFAAILLDVCLPDMDGFEVASLLRAHGRSRRAPILFQTAICRAEMEVFRGYEVGAVDYIIKPIVPEILRSKVSVFVDLALKTEMLRALEGRLRTRGEENERARRRLVDFLARIERWGRALESASGTQLGATGQAELKRIVLAAQEALELADGRDAIVAR
jgi:CheY-like chemotaxis protein